MISASKRTRSFMATVLGLVTSVCTAWAVIDFDNFDLERDWFKLFVIGMPAVGGFMSSLNEKK